MRTIKIKSLASLILVLLFSMSIYAQDMQEKGKCNLPNLTEEQQKKIDELKVPHQKEMLMLRNQLQEKKAHLQTIRTADKVDMNAINTTIDEIGAIQVDKMKKREAHKQDVRKLLTDEQRVAFDMRQCKKGKGHGRGMGYGMHRRGPGGSGNFQGNCDGSGPHGKMQN